MRIAHTPLTGGRRKRYSRAWLVVAHVLLAWSVQARAQPMDAVSREVSLLNDTADRYIVTDIVSREITVLNDVTDRFAITDIVSREVSLWNDVNSKTAIRDVVSREVALLIDRSDRYAIHDVASREVALLNDLVQRYQTTDTISREITFENAIHCAGDFTGDFDVTFDDVDSFVFVLTHPAPHPAWLDAADMNCDGKADGLDIQVFVDAILSQ